MHCKKCKLCIGMHVEKCKFWHNMHYSTCKCSHFGLNDQKIAYQIPVFL